MKLFGIELPYERSIFERLGKCVTRSPVSLQLDHHNVTLSVQSKQVNNTSKVRANLATYDQQLAILDDTIGIVLDPPFQNSLFVLSLKRSLDVLFELAVRLYSEDSHSFTYFARLFLSVAGEPWTSEFSRYRLVTRLHNLGNHWPVGRWWTRTLALLTASRTLSLWATAPGYT